MQFLKTYEALSQENLDKRRKEALFKKEIWKKIPKKDQDKLINLRYNLSTLRDEARYLIKRGDNRSDVLKRIKENQKQIKDLEQTYCDKYRDMFDILTSKILKDMDSKTGVFETKLPF